MVVAVRSQSRGQGQPPRVIENSALIEFCNYFDAHPAHLSSMDLPGGDVALFGNEAYTGEPFELLIPGRLAVPFIRSVTQLTGVTAPPGVFTKVFAHHNW